MLAAVNQLEQQGRYERAIAPYEELLAFERNKLYGFPTEIYASER